jgi:hypothetical protein
MGMIRLLRQIACRVHGVSKRRARGSSHDGDCRWTRNPALL